MFNKSKVICMIITSAALVFSGCQKNQETTDAKEALREAIQKLQQIQNYEMTCEVDAEVKSQENDSQFFLVRLEMKKQNMPHEIYQINVENDITLGEETQIFNTQQYLEKENKNNYLLYTNTQDAWEQKNIVSTTELQQEMLIPINDINSYLVSQEDITFSGKEIIEGRRCDEISVGIDGEKLPFFIKQLGILKCMGIDEADISGIQMFNDIDRVTFSAYIDRKTGEMVSNRIDLSDVMKNIITVTEGISEKQLNKISVKFKSTYSHFNELGEINIPDEVKAAKDK